MMEKQVTEIQERLGRVETSLSWIYKIGAIIGSVVIGVLAWIGSLIKEFLTVYINS